jgi:putative ABC transport system permease protein
MWILTALRTLGQDLQYSLRKMRRNPAFAFTVVFTLALGIGANTMIFSVVNAVLIEPLPYRDPERLVRLSENNLKRGVGDLAVSAPNFKDWQSQQTVFEHLAASEMATFNLTGTGEPERVASASITTNLLRVLGVEPNIGRGFLPEEETPGRNRVVLLSSGLWKRQFGGNPSVLNKTIQLNGESYEVVGIMPADFQFPGTRELWVPLTLDPVKEPWRADRANRNLSVYGRLKPGVTVDQASAEMKSITQRLEQQYPQSNTGWGVRVRTFYDWVVPQEVRRSMIMLFIAVGLLLLIACANVANLLLARARNQQRDMAIRSALGASRARLMQHLLMDSLLLAFLGGLSGLLLTFWGTSLIASSNMQNIARLSETRVDGRVLGFTFAISLITGLIFGLVPAWSASRLNLNEKLKEGGGGVSGRGTQRFSGTFVVAEVTLALALLVSAGLMMRSFLRLQAVPLGFAPENVLTMQISLPTSKYKEPEQRINFYHQLLERLQATPGVINAAAITQPPLSSGNWAVEIIMAGQEAAVGETRLTADARAATPHYFRTMGIPLLQGREFDEQDRADKPLALIISQSFARHYWPGENPIGKTFRPGADNELGTVVGVVGDVRNGNMREEAQPAFYFPYAYIGMQGLVVVVRTNSAPESLVTALRAQVREIDSNQPVYNIRTMEEIMSNATAQPRFQTMLLSLFSIVALLLSAVGIYSVMAYLVRQRRHEISIRMALGASAPDILKMVIKQGMRHVLLGVALGLAASFALMRLMKSLFFDVSAVDPLTFIMATLLLTGVGLAACYLPARHVTKIDPATLLQHE